MSLKQKLIDAFKITEEDLAANRQGILTARQKKMVLAATSDDATFMAGFAAFFAIVMYGILYFLIQDGRIFDFSKGISVEHIIILCVTAGLPTLGLIWSVYTIVIHRRTRSANQVMIVEGILELQLTRYRRGIVLHEMMIDNHKFALTPLVYGLLQSGKLYRVYYEPIATVVVAIEPVKEG
jgi:hypothetical protein